MKSTRRKSKLMPGGIPKWIRVYDNGGGLTRFCRRCLLFTDADVCDSKVLYPDQPGGRCHQPTIPAGPGTFDRYTVVFTGRYPGRLPDECLYLGMSSNPFHPQGFGQHGVAKGVFDVGPHGYPPKIGDTAPWGEGNRRVTFQRLSPECQRLVVREYKELWAITV